MLEIRRLKGHVANWGRIKAAECVQAMKEQAATSRESACSIIQKAVQKISSEGNVKILKKSVIKRTLRNVRRKNLPPEPKSFDELEEIPESYSKTVEGNRWLLLYEPDANEKMIILSSDNHLRYLKKQSYWIMDGTFKASPNLFLQLYAIHAQVHGQWFPLVLCLMQNKTKESYKTLFATLNEQVEANYKFA